VIGTEIASISPELEEHYKKYFSDRQEVVALHAKYAKVFSDLQARSDELVGQLKTLGTTIEDDTTLYNNEVNQLNSDIESFNARANSGGFSSEAQFNSERNRLTAKVSALDSLRNKINTNVATYESLREELASIASTSEALNKSIDSSLAPAPTL